jgi:hypothetical protein
MPNTDYIDPVWRNLTAKQRWTYGDDLPQVDTWLPSFMFNDGVGSGPQEVWIPHNAAWLLFIENKFLYQLI